MLKDLIRMLMYMMSLDINSQIKPFKYLYLHIPIIMVFVTFFFMLRKKTLSLLLAYLTDSLSAHIFMLLVFQGNFDNIKLLRSHLFYKLPYYLWIHY